MIGKTTTIKPRSLATMSGTTSVAFFVVVIQLVVGVVSSASSSSSSQPNNNNQHLYDGLSYEERQAAWKAYSESSLYNSMQSKENSPWIDPDTPEEDRQILSYPKLPFLNDEERVFDLVFSDEFMVDDRTMHDGRDPRWTALHSDDATNNPLHYYSHSNVRTSNGVLNITLDTHPQNFTYTRPGTNHRPSYQVNVTKEFRSGMIQSWNKFCFIGGIIEISAKLPGDPTVGGLWPAS
jgi:Beta-glucan synthesis-associated protein SKN1/KRE6/Sbg1